MAGFIDSAIAVIDGAGLFDLTLPFLFVFALVFGVLEKTRVFGSASYKRSIHVAFSLVVGLIFIASLDRVYALNNFLITLTAVLFLVFIVHLFAGLFYEKVEILSKWYVNVLMVVLFLVVAVLSFDFVAGDDFVVLFEFLINPFLWGVLVFILVIWYITRGEGVGSGSPGGSSAAPVREARDPSPPTSAPSGNGSGAARDSPAPNPEPRGAPVSLDEPVKRLEKDELYGGDDRTLWKGGR